MTQPHLSWIKAKKPWSHPPDQGGLLKRELFADIVHECSWGRTIVRETQWPDNQLVPVRKRSLRERLRKSSNHATAWDGNDTFPPSDRLESPESRARKNTLAFAPNRLGLGDVQCQRFLFRESEPRLQFARTQPIAKSFHQTTELRDKRSRE
jgi:hypothetical protein